MKPLYLEIEGVKSVSDKQTIDFERVAKSGIFGVFGKTGSGKTTILDSIVLAIYGATTGSVDNKDFINVGRDSARVNLLFSVSGMGKTSKYRVERSYKLDKKRENAISSAKLFEVSDDGEICIAEGSSKVNKKLAEVDEKASKRYVSDNFSKEKDKPKSWNELMDEYLNGENKDDKGGN